MSATAAAPPVDADLVAGVERAALWAWPPREVRHLHGWLLRAGDDRSRRANSARTLAFEAPRGGLGAALAEAEAWYAARGRPPCLQLTDAAAPDGLDRELAARGYARLTPSVVMLADAGRVAGGSDGGRGVELLHRPTQGVLGAMADPLWSDAARRGRAALLARIRRPHRFGLVVGPGGEPAAAGLVVADGDLAGLFALRTQAPHRRRGLGRRLAAALAGWAGAQGCRRLYLQAEEANAPALALYAGLGFAPAYRYWYREAGVAGG